MSETDLPRCQKCGEPVGVYEPLIWLRPEGPLETSLLGLRDEPTFDPQSAHLLHRACWRPG